eukprot:scaffold325_cov230-Pinguiococcus_pyrenoidosus.AAC.11
MGIREPERVLLGTLFGRVAHQKCHDDDLELPMKGGRRAQAGSAAAAPVGQRLLDICQDALAIMAELLQGAHLVVEGDHGWWYQYLRGSRLAYPRISSHESSEQEHGLFLGKTLKTLLTGTR